MITTDHHIMAVTDQSEPPREKKRKKGSGHAVIERVKEPSNLRIKQSGRHGQEERKADQVVDENRARTFDFAENTDKVIKQTAKPYHAKSKGDSPGEKRR